ncbi:acyl carrier protein [Cryptosporangium arvum]|uniref:Acyl carrier protein n=1 Tax=Cryptosporangium arvum DSM 44712 TaxID=927661 RepID=A0A010Z418_9ACTN|nr:acyl carrier protein [Cryptosporangium arvum]EXG82133.1 acyl carrier protein [Cryptosporangium arvum DSM 44712]
MSTVPEQTERVSADVVEQELGAYLRERLNTPVPNDTDLFAAGLVNSMFAMELVVHLEGTYGVAIVGPDLRLDNFRTITQMAALVQRLSAAPDGGDA